MRSLVSFEPATFTQGRVIKPGAAGPLTGHWRPDDFSLPAPKREDEDLAGLKRQAAQEAHAQAYAEARQQAAALLETAREQAAETLHLAQEAAKEVTRQAHEAGLAAAQSEVSATLQTAQAMVEAVQEWRERLFGQSEPMVVGLVQQIAQKLFGVGMVLEPEALKAAFERALDEAQTLGPLRIRAHPKDVAELGALWPAHQTSQRGQAIEMIPNQEIQRGGCYIEGQFGSVDSRIETQMRLIHQTIEETLHSPRPADSELLDGEISLEELL